MTAARRVGRPARADLSSQDVADRFGVTVMTVNRWVSRGEIAYVDVGTGRRRYRFTEDAVADLIEARTHREGRTA